jgi:hypothetical protein
MSNISVWQHLWSSGQEWVATDPEIPGSIPQHYQILWEVVGLERGPLSLLRIIEELLEWKNSGSVLENRD